MSVCLETVTHDNSGMEGCRKLILVQKIFLALKLLVKNAENYKKNEIVIWEAVGRIVANKMKFVIISCAFVPSFSFLTKIVPYRKIVKSLKFEKRTEF